ncbi:MAG: hypothetical protein RR922_03320 [Clostridia bacterium]
MAEYNYDSCNRVRLEFEEQYGTVVRKIEKNNTILRDLQVKYDILKSLSETYNEYSEELDKIDNEIMIAKKYGSSLENEKVYAQRKVKELDRIQYNK